MTKAEIVQAIYNRLGGFSKREAADLVDLVFETMKETLGRGEKIKISGFGNFVLRDKRQRQGRNPQTGDPIVITERRVLSFKASNILKHGLNPKRSHSAAPSAGGLGQAGGGHGSSAGGAPRTPSATTASSAARPIVAVADRRLEGAVSVGHSGGPGAPVSRGGSDASGPRSPS
jgi:integration host factor subunit alpha